MIKFFRNIRQNLLNEGKTANYLKYAIGEIVLVVIGILIALSINNWNQERINNINEMKVLGELKNDLDATIKDLDYTILFIRQSIDSTIVLLEYIDAQVPYDTSFNTAFFHTNTPKWLYPSTITYENLKSSGINTITNDRIKTNLTEVFDQKLQRIKDIEDRMLELLWVNNQELKKVCVYTEINHSGATTLIPDHFENFKNNRSLVNSIIYLNNRRMTALEIYKNYRESVLELKLLVSKELNN
jgi:hypothetical protein